MTKPLAALARCAAVLVLTMMLAGTAAAQETGTFGRIGTMQASGVSYNTFARPGEPTIQIYVVGQSAGIYEVGSSVTLGELYVLMSGPSDADADINVRLYRGQDGERRQIYEADYERLITSPQEYPPLQENDLVEIEVKQRDRFGWRDGLQIVTSAASLVLLVDRLNRIF